MTLRRRRIAGGGRNFDRPSFTRSFLGQESGILLNVTSILNQSRSYMFDTTLSWMFFSNRGRINTAHQTHVACCLGGLLLLLLLLFWLGR